MAAVTSRLRPRMPDCYDPDPRYGWVVEMSDRLRAEEVVAIQTWLKQNTKSSSVVYGTLAAFEDMDEANLFYIAYS